MSKVNYYTPQGYEKLKAELQDLKTRGRAEMAKQISEAREKGDLSENAEYDAAKEAQGLLEYKISQLNEAISHGRVLDKSKMDTSRFQVLSNVKMLNTKLNKEFSYQLVSETEAELKTGKISVTSPIGTGLLGKSMGDVVEIKVPNGTMQFKILEITA